MGRGASDRKTFGRPRRALGRRCLAALLLVLGAAARAGAQVDEEARQHGIFIDSVEVSLINLAVFAERDAEPVTDLVADDFEILDDGEPVVITNFEWIGGVAEAEAPAGEAEDRGADRPSRAADPSAVIVMVDQLFLSPPSRRQIFDLLTAQLEPMLDRGARIMVAAKSRERVAIEQHFTANRRLVEAALERLAGAAPADYSREIVTTVDLWELTPEAVESRQTGPGQPEPALQTAEIDARSAFQQARDVSQRIHADVRSSLDALHGFLDSLAGLPGRKALVYIADTLPLRPAELLWRIWWEKYGFEHGARLGATPSGPTELDATAQLEGLIVDANANRVAFYPIGLDAGPNLGSAGSRGVELQSRAFARTAGSGAGDGLRWLSERTGGRRAGPTSASEEFFADLSGDLHGYYSIAYPSPHGGDGKVHRVEVRVRRPGVTLRYPTEYRDKSHDQRMRDRVLSTLTLGVEENLLDLRVETGKAKREGGGLFSVPLAIHVPLANLVLVPDTRSHRGKLTVQLIARDSRGRLSEPVVVRLPLEVHHRDLARALTQTVDYDTRMTLRRGAHTIAVGVHDDFGLTSSTVGVEIEVGGSG